MFILIAFSLLVTQRQYFGDPIDCKSQSSVDPALLDTFCWIQSTYTLPEVKNGPYAGVHNPYDHRTGEQHTKRHHTYYQWVTLFLYLQAVLFYVPRYLWKIWEGGKLKMLVDGLQLPMADEEETLRKKEMLVSYFKTNLNDNDLYAYKFILCELLNFINVIGQIYLTNAFVGYEFTTYGLKVIAESELPFYSRHDVLEYVFPKVTKCDFYYYGAGGSTQNVDALCVLPLNVINEKMYIILWFWFIFVGIFSGLGLIYRSSTFSGSVRQMLLRTMAKISNSDDVRAVNESCKFGDWFLLYQIAKNIDPNIFREFIHDLAREFKYS